MTCPRVAELVQLDQRSTMAMMTFTIPRMLECLQTKLVPVQVNRWHQHKTTHQLLEVDFRELQAHQEHHWEHHQEHQLLEGHHTQWELHQLLTEDSGHPTTPAKELQLQERESSPPTLRGTEPTEVLQDPQSDLVPHQGISHLLATLQDQSQRQSR